MPAKVSYPGVYVQEEPSGARAVAAASTSTALFVGMIDRGPFGIPTRVLSLVEYERNFGASSSGEMADQVRQFYVNGGTEAWIMRIANGAEDAGVTLQTAANAPTIHLTARDVGVAGNMIRAEVDYDTASPERSFNLTLYRSSVRSDGSFERKETETYSNLSLDHGSARYAPNIVNGASALVTLTDLNAAAGITGASIGGVIYRTPAATAQNGLNALIAVGSKFRCTIANNPPVDVVLTSTTAASFGPAVVTAYGLLGITVNCTSGFVSFAGGLVLEIASTTGAVVITPAAANDAAVPLMLGTAQGGIELDSTGLLRPAPTGLSSRVGTVLAGAAGVGWLDSLDTLAQVLRSNITNFNLTDPTNPGAHTALTNISKDATQKLFETDPAPATPAPIGSLANVGRALGEIATAIATAAPNRWSARRIGYRLVLNPKFGGANDGLTSVLTTTPNAGNIGASIFPTSLSNVAAYSVGQQGGLAPVGKQSITLPGDLGGDGTKPLLGDYQAAFGVIESELDSFNLMILPRADQQTDAERKGLWGTASALAAKRRAILLVDPDSAWNSIASAESGVAGLKVGVETRNAAIFWPRLKIPDATITAGKTVDPSGSIAGLMARTDTAKGVWAAPAGIEATIRGIVGVDRNMSDEENGVLNPKALNAIRLFPSGAVAWGARTMVGSDDTGDIDNKYIPVRRTMLFIEESLYRGLKFAVFQPNAEPLWASIRLAAGSFMNGLMRQGAFASRNKLEAYFVLCDASTTTPTDQNLGIVNVVVGFAPLKPAEFVVLTVKQIAGQAAV